MRAEELFGIDVAAEVETLCGAQLQGPWQVPAEVVRLANARGAARVAIRRGRGTFRIRCDGVLASIRELEDLVEVFDSEASRRRRQEAISRVETAGLSALLWAVGLPGARMRLTTSSGGGGALLTVRAEKIELDSDKACDGPPATIISWRCRGLNHRRAVAWLRTALRFVPIPVTVCGREVERGFPGGLYRMRISEPLPGEIAVTASGEAPSLWLLEHGVLSARAVVPGFPAFSAALEMSHDVPPGSSADRLRAAANPYLESLIDQAARMLLLLVDRLSSADEPVRARLSSLLLRFAVRGVRGDQIRAAPMVGVRRGSRRWLESPLTLARWAARRGNVISAVDPGSNGVDGSGGRLVEATAEERSLLSDLLGVHIESMGGGRSLQLRSRLGNGVRRCWRAIRGLGARPLGPHELSEDERRLVGAAAGAGVNLAISEGGAEVRGGVSLIVIGRDRPEVRAAARAVADSEEWLYPALLAVVGEDVPLPNDLRERWLEAAGR